jgi:hypothetical protein
MRDSPQVLWNYTLAPRQLYELLALKAPVRLNIPAGHNPAVAKQIPSDYLPAESETWQ